MHSNWVRRKTFWVTFATAVIVLGVIGAGAFAAYTRYAYIQKDAAYRQLMGLTVIGNAPAPGFQLLTQTGKRVSLRALRGKVVVLEFMDPRCTDICPIVSQEFIQADHLLQSQQSHVVFVAVNVNQYHESIQDVSTFSREQGLNRLPNWYFLTGSTQALQKVWREYGVFVQPNKTGDVVHSSLMFFINSRGIEEYVANPDNNKATMLEWGDAIAFYTQHLGNM